MNLVFQELHHTLTVSDFDHLIYHIKNDHPDDGERFMIGHLSALGVHVPRAKLSASIHRVDSINTAFIKEKYSC